MKPKTALVAFAAFLALVAAANIFFRTEAESIEPPYVRIGDSAFRVEVADSPDEWTRGLSGRESLPEGSGMLFVFDRMRLLGFWMKDMIFPIDIIWMSKNGVIVHIENDVSPDTYPKVFTPDSPALYVLEVPAGTAKEKNIKIGDRAIINI